MASCQDCVTDVFFKSPKEFFDHLKNYHYYRPNDRVQCPLCFVTYSRMNRFEIHFIKCFKKKGKNATIPKVNFNSRPPVLQGAAHAESTPHHCENAASNDPGLESCEVPLSTSSIFSSINEPSLTELFDTIALEFALSLHSQPNLTRKDVFKIQNFVTENIFNKLSVYLLNMTSKLDSSVEIKSKLVRALKSIPTIFDNVNTEHLLNNTLTKRELMKPAKDFVISRDVGITFENRRALYDIQNTTGTLLPISFQVSAFAKRNGRIEEMVSNLEKYSNQSDAIRHYIQGSTWKSMMETVQHEEDTIYLPLGLYTDGLQYNNSLGAHTDSVDNLYYYYPLLEDPFHKNNIHLAACLKSIHVKSYGNGKCFQDLIECLLDLFYVGFEATVKGKKKRIKFLLGIVIGDNLALNTILEYVPSFRANHFCRICTMSREEAATACYEALSKLRTIENYQRDLSLNDSKKTGIKGDCVFNQLSYFHSVLNRVLEIMHDFFEGIIKYVVCQFLLKLIEDKILTLEEINTCIADLDYAKEDVKYIPKPLDLKKLRENNLKMSARECWQFIYLLPICLGDRIPDSYPAWELVLCLIEITEIILGSTFYESTLQFLSRLVRKFCTHYKSLFGDLKPKMHFATHLPTAIRAMGPPRQYMCFKMESFHRFFKIYGHVMPNRKNISLSFAKKYQYNFAFVIFKNEIYSKISYGNVIETEFSEYIFPGRKFYKELNYKGTEYKLGKYLPLQEGGVEILYEIKELCVSSGRIYVVALKIATCCFNIHLHSFVLNRIITEETNFIPLELFDSIPLNIYKLADGKEIIRPKNFFENFQDINISYDITSF